MRKRGEGREQIYEYRWPDGNIELLLEAVTEWYEGQGLEVWRRSDGPGSFALRCRTPVQWRRAVGMSTSLDLDFDYGDPKLVVTLLEVDRLAKAVAAGSGLAASGLAMFPLSTPIGLGLVATSVMGARKQRQIGRTTVLFISSWLEKRSGERIESPTER